MPTGKKHKKPSKFTLIFNFIKKVWATQSKGSIIKKTATLALVSVFILLGFRFGCTYQGNGFQCSTGYTPPKPEDVKKIIKMDDRKGHKHKHHKDHKGGKNDGRKQK